MEKDSDLDDDLDDVATAELNDIDTVEFLPTVDRDEEQLKKLTARRRIEELLEEKRLREEIDDFDHF